MLTAAGVDLTPRGVLPAWSGPDSVVVLVRDREVLAVHQARRPMIMRGGAADSAVVSLVRVELPREAILPDSLGVLPAVTVRARDRVSRGWITIGLGAGFVRAMWEGGVDAWASRAEPLRAAGALRLPQPADAELRLADQRYRAGDAAGAVSIALHRLRGGGAPLQQLPLEAQARRHASALVADALQQLGDTVSWRAFVHDIMADEPCLTFAAGATAAQRALAGALRPAGARCTPIPSGESMRSALLPGRGDQRDGHATIGRAVSLVTTTLLAGGVVFAVGSHSAYSRYQAARSGTDATAAYQSATDRRTMSSQLLLSGAALWALDALLSVTRDAAHASAVRSVTGYGACDTRAPECAP
jgi:hypothetical protein